jgi:transposase
MESGRAPIAPGRLLKPLLIHALCSIRSERELCRCLETGLLFRWRLDMTHDEDVFGPTVCTHSRERLAEHGPTSRFFGDVMKQVVGNAVPNGGSRSESISETAD